MQSAASAQAFGIPARVAMISYSTGDSGSGVDVDKVREATRLAREQRPDLLIDGPLQYDAAAIASVGRQKAPNSPVAGQATVFIFPDLNTGNTTYKAVQRSADCVSVGPMLQGLRKPVNDLSRGAEHWIEGRRRGGRGHRPAAAPERRAHRGRRAVRIAASLLAGGAARRPGARTDAARGAAGGGVMSLGYDALRDFLYREARYLDDKDWDAWLALYARTPVSGCRPGTTATSSPRTRSGKSR